MSSADNVGRKGSITSLHTQVNADMEQRSQLQYNELARQYGHSEWPAGHDGGTALVTERESERRISRIATALRLSTMGGSRLISASRLNVNVRPDVQNDDVHLRPRPVSAERGSR